MRLVKAAAASILVLGTALLAGSCWNPLNWSLQTWATLDMVTVPGGLLPLGDVEGWGAYLDETPVHNVTVSTFRISRFEVTQAMYENVMGVNPSWFQSSVSQSYGDEPTRPVERVSWQDAVSFCNSLSLKAGLTPCYAIDGSTVTWNTSADGYRLPTEAEWEYAARGGQSSGAFMFSGSSSAGEVAWYNMNAPYDIANDVYITQPVGGRNSNELDLYDMSGNVKEWVWDTYYIDYYSDIYPSSTNPRGPSGTVAPINVSASFVLRGGSVESDYDYVRNALRFLDWDTYWAWDVGFRVARNN